jgi:hypothetical protein
MKFIHLCHDENERCCYGYRLRDRRPKKPCSLRRRHDLFPKFCFFGSEVNYVILVVSPRSTSKTMIGGEKVSVWISFHYPVPNIYYVYS